MFEHLNLTNLNSKSASSCIYTLTHHPPKTRQLSSTWYKQQANWKIETHSWILTLKSLTSYPKANKHVPQAPKSSNHKPTHPNSKTPNSQQNLWTSQPLKSNV